MNDLEYEFLPEVNSENNLENESSNLAEIIGDSACPCCGYITIPNKGDALAYICPVCMWEIDLFIHTEDELSDLNHGLSLKEAKENYRQYGSSEKSLKKYCREPKETEQP